MDVKEFLTSQANHVEEMPKGEWAFLTELVLDWLPKVAYDGGDFELHTVDGMGKLMALVTMTYEAGKQNAAQS